MHAVVTTIPLKRPLTTDETARIARELPPLVASRPGYRAFYWAAAGEAQALTVSLWDSPAEAEAALEQVRPWLVEAIGPLIAGAPTRQLAEVLVADEAGFPR